MSGARARAIVMMTHEAKTMARGRFNRDGQARLREGFCTLSRKTVRLISCAGAEKLRS